MSCPQLDGFRHQCPDWDFMEITLHDMEAVGCTCYIGDPLADALYEARSLELDELNKSVDKMMGNV